MNDSTTPDVGRGAPSLSARLEQQAFWFEGLGAYPVLVALLREAAETITRLETACQASSVPAGAEAGLLELIDRLENYYDFECTGGPLKHCVEWQRLKEAVPRRNEGDVRDADSDR